MLQVEGQLNTINYLIKKSFSNADEIDREEEQRLLEQELEEEARLEEEKNNVELSQHDHDLQDFRNQETRELNNK